MTLGVVEAEVLRAEARAEYDAAWERYTAALKGADASAEVWRAELDKAHAAMALAIAKGERARGR